ncbi:hypothetical protein [Sunxiuqinia dokdonensis]|uniref:Uncharacterized protein n=1 Tax=Sunxiuqinia dokdonensis TaxID=1409788 RepID=A0A0L8VF17_9BACT|nr:hypothetical protein [Sunxiuqinia dokdonensis]KOH47056.1 hypothetical protein NC99_00990 [Sunxiuqinia dokdonensis]
MKDVTIPKQETKTKRMIVLVTPTEHKRIKQYCRDRKVTLTNVIRFALKETFDL